jgi:hypothetical protein
LEESVPLFAPLLALALPENGYPMLNLSPQRQRQKTLETIVTILLEQAEQQPVLFIVEDLHWTDPTTLEWLNLLIDQTPTASMLVLLTCRPYFQPDWHHRSYLTEALVGFQGRGYADVIQPHCCHPALLEALLFQWPSIRRCAARTMVEHKTPESNKSAPIRIQGGQGRELAPDAVVGQAPALQMITPGDDVRPGHLPELRSAAEAGKGDELPDIPLVILPGVAVAPIDEPLGFRGGWRTGRRAGRWRGFQGRWERAGCP